MHSCSASSGKPDSNSLDCIVFFLLCDVSWLKDVERWEDLLFWCLMYLYHEVICLYRCLCGNWCICKTLIFSVADTLFGINVSTRLWYSLLQMLFWESMYLQLTFLRTCRYFSACLSCTIASTSCLFWDLKILPLQILHLHPTFSITWRCSPVKLRIRNLLFQYFADTSHQNFASSLPENPLSQIPFTQYPLRSIYFTTWANTLLTKKLI